ncbi:Telomere reverse transcriptase [Penicillium mononematosum]|uniref:Telomere reverse transcriptase n=1 Tax=Penicillium mononematosum TaxID=268346 RepID=UPI002547F17A|nr:Telomere reverse transcriptase [Penicillium mononematosum]KAJ6184750.1 Telomere reverse transcriptase [Penicillium mononematosum]
MGKKRKRPIKDRGPTSSSHMGITTSPRRFRNPHAPISLGTKTSHPVISLYYRQVVPLREYLLQQLPVTSKSRRRRILTLDSREDQETNAQSQTLAELLDSTLVGVLKDSSPTLNSERQKQYSSFNESQSRSILISTDTGPTCPQSEVVDFVIWKLFNNNNGSKPQHLLTHGFQRPSMVQNVQQTNIPGIVSQFPNQNVQVLKGGAWAEVLDLLGSNGEEIMMQLLFDCGVFAAINARKGIYYQLSGIPLSDLEPLSDASSRANKSAAIAQDPMPTSDPRHTKEKAERKQNSDKTLRSPNSIVFLRRRILYGRVESKKKVPCGLGQTHVLSRFSSLDSMAQTVHVMKYIFPRQFGLLNVFTSDSDGRNTMDDSKRFIFRESEISRLEEAKRLQRPQPEIEFADADHGVRSCKVPKRLRGITIELVRKLRNRNAQCPYGELLRHYCPTEQTGPSRLGALASTPDAKKSEPISSLQSALVTQVRINQPSPSGSSAQTSCEVLRSEPHTAVDASSGINSKEPASRKAPVNLTDYATPASSVSAFCRAVIQKLIPRQFWGAGPDGISNFKLVLRHVDRFIKLRRFESLSLHEVCKGVKITSIPWLGPQVQTTSTSETRSKIALSDLHKRTELFHEFIFWIFDSILIPLIRSHFYVTESQTHRNRLFYFRHDLWQQLTKQPFGDLKATMFEELEPDQAQRVLTRRSLGFGALRLLPKSTGLRPILNLRKRAWKESSWGKSKTYLAASINSSITPIYNMLTYECQQVPAKLGSSMLSIGDMHRRLKAYKEQLSKELPSGHKPWQSKLPQMYFVKLDIKACFDTIPQEKLLNLIAELVSEESYHISNHVEFQPPLTAKQGKPTRRFMSRAAPAMRPHHLPDFVNSGGAARKANTVFVDTMRQKVQDADSLLDLLNEHVRHNLVKIGKKYFRQRNGIPQGSVLSSVLCNFFYAELEREVLGFINEDSLLLRLVDDFLLITPDAVVAMQFLEVMIRGQPSYGVQVNPAKSMANFSATVDGILLPRLEGTQLFPYCGSLIDTRTLDIHRDRDRILEGGESAAATLSNTLTVEASRFPGRTFHRKVLSSFRLQLHPMYIDDGHNSRTVVLANIYCSFITSAMKMYRYMKSLRGRAHPGPAIITQTIRDLILQTAGMIQARRAGDSESSFSCFVQRYHLQYLASAAFRFVLKRKQTRYEVVLRWLRLANQRFSTHIRFRDFKDGAGGEEGQCDV